MATLEGSPAPQFSLPDESGKHVTLAELLKQGPLLIVFYPGDFTPVCTKQLCAYQEAHETFAQYNVHIVGISENASVSHQRFKDKYGFQFPLLTDEGKRTFRAYGVTSLFMFGGTSRAVFVVDRQGIIRYRYVEPTAITHRKPKQLIEILDELRKKGQI